MERRRFLATTALGLPLLGSSALSLPGQWGAQQPVPPVKPAQLEAELVKEFVRVGHNDLAEVQRMRAIAMYRNGDLAEAAAAFSALAEDESRPTGTRDAAADWLDRIRRESPRR